MWDMSCYSQIINYDFKMASMAKQNPEFERMRVAWLNEGLCGQIWNFGFLDRPEQDGEVFVKRVRHSLVEAQSHPGQLTYHYIPQWDNMTISGWVRASIVDKFNPACVYAITTEIP